MDENPYKSPEKSGGKTPSSRTRRPPMWATILIVWVLGGTFFVLLDKVIVDFVYPLWRD